MILPFFFLVFIFTLLHPNPVRAFFSVPQQSNSGVKSIHSDGQSSSQFHLKSSFSWLMTTLSSSSSSLNQDGDFCILGLNDDGGVGASNNDGETPTSSGYLSSLLNVDYSSTISSDTLPEYNAEEQQSSTDIQMMGLTEDGDFMLDEINFTTDEDSRKEQSIHCPMSVSQQQSSYPPSQSPQMPLIDTDVQSRKEYHNLVTDARIVEEDHHQEVEAVQAWLMDIFPTLQRHYNHEYAQKLVSIGFDPSCASQCELKFEDLEFMKLLHQRYVYNEIIGQAHPWEP